MLVSHRLTPTWPLHTNLYNFARNISTNISTSGQRTYLKAKLGELPSLSIVYNITISSLYPLNGFRFYFLLRDSENTLLVKIPFIVFHLARLIFTGQTSPLDMVYPRHSSFFRTFCFSRDSYTRTVMAL